MTPEARIALLEGLLQEWIEKCGGCGPCSCEVCAGDIENPDEPDLDPGHDPECIQLKTCMALLGKPQRQREGGGR